MAENERFDIERRLARAKMEFRRYGQRLVDNPQKKGQLEPILQGYREVIWDLEDKLQQLELQEARVEASPV